MDKETLKEWRIKNGLSQVRLGKILDASPATIHGWETGRNNISLDFVQKWLEAYGFNPTEKFEISLDKRGEYERKPKETEVEKE